MALAYLAKIYSLRHKLTPKFYIVDHKLREDSTKEAKLVKKLLKKKLINAEILRWDGIKPQRNIQSIARKKRYELLFKKCKKHKINNILLGHHKGDLFENFFLRLLRGSGLKGLISLDRKINIGQINLIRPLLDHQKDDLCFISKHVFNFYVKDPSNVDEKFQRIKIRNLLQKLSENGLDEHKFFKTIKNLKKSNEVVNFYVQENLNNNTFFFKSKNQIILSDEFFKKPNEIVFRAFSDLVKIIGKKYYPSRGKKLDKVICGIKKNTISKVTLGGCIIEKVNQTVIISKEH